MSLLVACATGFVFEQLAADSIDVVQSLVQALVRQDRAARDDHTEEIWERLVGAFVERDGLESDHRETTFLHRFLDLGGDLVDAKPVFRIFYQLAWIEMLQGWGEIPEAEIREIGVEDQLEAAVEFRLLLRVSGHSPSEVDALIDTRRPALIACHLPGEPQFTCVRITPADNCLVAHIEFRVLLVLLENVRGIRSVTLSQDVLMADHIHGALHGHGHEFMRIPGEGVRLVKTVGKSFDFRLFTQHGRRTPTAVDMHPEVVFIANLSHGDEIVITAEDGRTSGTSDEEGLLAVGACLFDGGDEGGRDHGAFGIDGDLDAVVSAQSQEGHGLEIGVMSVSGHEDTHGLHTKASFLLDTIAVLPPSCEMDGIHVPHRAARDEKAIGIRREIGYLSDLV